MKKKQTYLLIIVALVLLGGLLWLQGHLGIGLFSAGKCSRQLNRQSLEQSLQLGKRFLLNNQHSEGNFTYQYDWIKKEYAKGDNSVRQAGAAWGLSLLYQYDPSAKLQAAVEKALAFFEKHSKTDTEERRYIIYPGDHHGSTGTVALVALAHIDFLRKAEPQLPADKATKLKQHLDQYLAFLVNARRSDGRWHSRYRHNSGAPYGSASPYFDGEALLVLVKAAKYRGKELLWEKVLASAKAGHQLNIVEALKKDPDSKTTKGYYQWSSMAFFEIATSGKPDTEKYGDYVIDLADWMIDVHKTLRRTRNTAYAYEGVIPAFELARHRKLEAQAKKFRCVIEQGLEKLTSWQVGHPLANSFIASRPTDDPQAIGGIQNHRKEAPLRIDVTQHQMHAVILALRYVFTEMATL